MKVQMLDLRIDWSELDLLGHVNNISVIKYFQAARIHFLSNIGLTPEPGISYGPIEAATEVRFKRQLHYPGRVKIYTTIKNLKNTSFILEHWIFDQYGQPADHGTEVIVCFDFKNQVKAPISDEVRRKIEEYTATFTVDLPENAAEI